MSRMLVLVATALAVSLPAGASSLPEESARPLAATKYAWLTGDPQARSVALRAAAVLDEAVPRIAALVGTDDLLPVPGVVYVRRSRFLAATGLPSRSPTVGLALLPEGVIHIDGTGLLASVERVLLHEVGHVMIGRAVGPALPALPLWLNEGIAEYAAGQRAAQVDPVALEAITRGATLELAELDASLRIGGKQGGLAYAEAASLVNFLVDQRGESVIADLLRELREQGRFVPALEQTTGWSETELESDWRRSVVRRWALPTLLQSPMLPFGLMVLLFLAALVRFLRVRRQRREDDERDAEEL